MNATVFYDLDHTLIGCDSDYEWGQFLADSGNIDGDAYRARNQTFYDDYRHGSLDPVAYLEFVLAPLGQIDGQRLEELRAQFLETRILPVLRPRARQLISEHRQRGLRQVVVTLDQCLYRRTHRAGIGDSDLDRSPTRDAGRAIHRKTTGFLLLRRR